MVVDRAGNAGLDCARQPFTMSNHRVEVLFQSGVVASAWSFGLAPLSRFNTWQVVVQMTSNPKSVQIDQRSFPGFLAFWAREIVGIGTSTKLAAQKPSVNKQDDVLSPQALRWALSEHEDSC